MKITGFEEVGNTTVITVEQLVPFSLTDTGVELNFVPNVSIAGIAYVELNVPKFLKVPDVTEPETPSLPWVGDSIGSQLTRRVVVDQDATYSYGDGLVIYIPRDSSEKGWELTLNQVVDPSQLIKGEVLLSKVFELIKNFAGNFLSPLTLTFRFDPDKLKEHQMASVFYYDDASKEWIELGGKVIENKITVKVDHFTKFAVMAVDALEEELNKPEIDYSDIVGHWAESAIKKAIKEEIVSGYPDGSFKPNRSLTRAEFSLMLINKLGLAGEAPALTFSDRDQIGDWAQNAIELAVGKGIINGYADHSFRPNGAISRAEMVVMITRALGLSLELEGGIQSDFADEQEIPLWAKSAVTAAKQQGWIKGRDNNRFVPLGSVTRAEAVTVILGIQ